LNQAASLFRIGCKRIILLDMHRAYWAVRCATDGCGIYLLTKDLGVYEPGLVPTLPESLKSFDAGCAVCGKTHTYDRSQIEVFIRPEDPMPNVS
jgi:hypothetical protein